MPHLLTILICRRKHHLGVNYESIDIARFDAGVAAWNGGGEQGGASATSATGSGVLWGHHDPDLKYLVADDGAASARLLVTEAPLEMVQILAPSEMVRCALEPLEV